METNKPMMSADELAESMVDLVSKTLRTMLDAKRLVTRETLIHEVTEHLPPLPEGMDPSPGLDLVRATVDVEFAYWENPDRNEAEIKKEVLAKWRASLM